MKTDYAIVVPGESGEHEINYVTKFDNPTDANMIAKAIHGEKAYAVEAAQWDIQMPTVYKDGIFYNVRESPVLAEDGSIVETKRELVLAERIPIEAEKIAKLSTTVAELQSANAELMLVVSDIIGGEEDAK